MARTELTPSVSAPTYSRRLLAALLVACVGGGLLGGFAIAQLLAPPPGAPYEVIVVRPPAVVGCPHDEAPSPGEPTLQPLGAPALVPAPAAHDDAESATTLP